MMKLHWNTLDKDKIQNSVWASARQSAGTGTNSELAPDEVAMMENLFCAKPTTSIATKKPQAKKENAVESLIDPRRSNNVSISLAQFKKFANYAALAQALIELDSTFLDLEKLQTLQTLLPNQQVRIHYTLLLPNQQVRRRQTKPHLAAGPYSVHILLRVLFLLRMEIWLVVGSYFVADSILFVAFVFAGSRDSLALQWPCAEARQV
jgi:hypothetical protein